MKPRLATLASWVGYDLDGRTDIAWTFSFLVRVREKQAALNDIRERFLELKGKLGDDGEVLRLSRQLTGKLDLAIAAVDEQIAALVRGRLGRLHACTGSQRHNAAGGLQPRLRRAADRAPRRARRRSAQIATPKRAVAALSGLLQATGLGTSHIHLRVNAVQINNAFRAFVHEPWTRDLTERQALARIVEMIRTAKPESVNFETLDLETATAIRQFALAAQIAKHVDRDTPIRYLIAECESPATLLIAVFFAKLFGVDKIVDISPLFETPAALETGGRVIERLLKEEAYRDYVRGRGRLCVQTGYSDAGRFIGQIAAGLAHERLHLTLAEVGAQGQCFPASRRSSSPRTAKAWGAARSPAPVRRRLRYVFSGEARWRFFRNEMPVKHETSFQGGDGYLFFANREFAERVADDGHHERPRSGRGRGPVLQRQQPARSISSCACAPTSSTSSRIRATGPCSARSGQTSCSGPDRAR